MLNRAYLERYDSGANNDPRSGQSSLNMKVVPLVWVTNDSKPSQGTTAAQARSKFAGWNKGSSSCGGRVLERL